MVCDTEAAIAQEAIQFYSQLFTAGDIGNNEPILSCIPHVISDQQNRDLLVLPSKDEVRQAIWALDQHGAPGPDGSSGIFFHSGWEVDGDDVHKAVMEFFIRIPIPKAVGSALTLLPRKETLIFADCRLICLSTFISKVTTCILAVRLRPMLDQLISPKQIGFVPHHDISEQTLLANDMVHHSDREEGLSYQC